MTQPKYRYLGPEENNDRIVEIDDETAIWLARMCVGEGGKRCSEEKCSAMFWALLNRFFLHSGRKNWESYLYLMRAFSQPINPKWQKGGPLAKRYKGKPSASPARLRRRAWICGLEWDDIPEQIRRAVETFRDGVLPPPSDVLALEKNRISNWASYAGLKEKYPWGIKLEKSAAYDWFFEDRRIIRGNVVIDHFSEKFA